MGYLPIADYGVIGDLHTVALVGNNGSIDWLCFPEFDSPGVFAALLDDQKGGFFKISPVGDTSDFMVKQMYLPSTNILITRFFSEEGLAEITDFMPVESETDQVWNHRIIRRVSVTQGDFRFRLICQPAFNYARTEHTTEKTENGLVFRTKDLHLALVANQEDIDFSIEGERGKQAAVTEFTLHSNQTVNFVFYRVEQGTSSTKKVTNEEIDNIFHDTVKFWQHWLSRCTYQGRWRESVHRSALVLKLLTYAPTGAIVAAPTTSLPEAIGAGRNWDYRYTWIRDASFTCYALLSLGFEMEAHRFMGWVAQRCKESEPTKGGLQIMYGLDGRRKLTEEVLDHLAGYKDSRPVRIGNAAYKQLQLDIYGELMDAVYLYNKYGRTISYEQWTYLRELMNWLCKNWQEPDDGLWEVRSGKQRFVYSRFMTWVALDRAIRLAHQRGLPADTALWEKTRSQVYEEVIAKGYSEQEKCFVQYYGSDTVDACNLLMPIVKFLGPDDPLFTSTLDKILKELTFDSLVYRYNLTKGATDGLTAREGTFSLCSFWLVEALTLCGRLDEARLKLEKMFSYANHLGLYSEEIGTSGQMLGNYPQAFTHLSLINATINLDRALKDGNKLSRIQS